MMEETEELTIAEEREKIYRFLSSLCLKPPSDSILSMIRDGSIYSAVHADPQSRGYTELANFMEEAEDMPDLEDELAAEHTSLFVLAGDRLPHEAVYLDSEKRLGGRITISVRQFYENAGANIAESCIEMPDHIGMELEFMGFLCKMEKGLRLNVDSMALRKCIELQKTFLEEHLLKWVYPCCEKIIEHATYSFYKAIAHLIIEFMKDEEVYIPHLYANVSGNPGVRPSSILQN